MQGHLKLMKAPDLLQLRLANTGLSTSPFNSPEAVIANLGALQAQDFNAAKWAIGLRMQNATNQIVENAFNEGKFLRIHVMRPTWHFVLPEDIRWMLELTAPRVKRLMAPYNQRLAITEEKLSKIKTELKKAWEGKKALTRAELADHLATKGMVVHGQRLAHILAYAELDGLICSGPKRDKQFTYNLLEERVKRYKALSQEEAIAKLTLKYFTSHGPAQIRDFVWWSGLSAKEADKTVLSVQSKLCQTNLNGKTYWFSNKTKDEVQGFSSPHFKPAKRAFLLSIYDEYTIAYKDRSDISEKRDIERMISMGNALTAVIILDGKVAGTWKRILKKDNIIIKLDPFTKLNEDKLELIEEAAKQFGKFWKKNVRILPVP
jgi:hypothetical protein